MKSQADNLDGSWLIFRSFNRLYKEQVKTLLFTTLPTVFSKTGTYRKWKQARGFEMRHFHLFEPGFWRRQFLFYDDMPISFPSRDPNYTVKISKIAVVVHVFYPEILPEILSRLTDSGPLIIKLFITCPGDRRSGLLQVLNGYTFEYEIFETINRGRDILPFIKLLPHLQEQGFPLIVKVHTKVSHHLKSRDRWRDELFAELLNDKNLKNHVRLFESNPYVGMLGPQGNLLPVALYYGRNAQRLKELCIRMKTPGSLMKQLFFVAGSMFIARTESLAGLLTLGLDTGDFEPEGGQLDGTMAHVVERALAAVIMTSGRIIVDSSSKPGHLRSRVSFRHSFVS